jgi:DNA-binding MarR family transcriptional regulator
VSTALQPDRRVDEFAGEFMAVMAGIRRLVRRQLRRELPGPKLPAAQLELLLVVEADPGVGVAAAARELNLAANSVSTLVNALVAAGMLRRETDPRDRRAARLHPTGAARRRLSAWRTARAQLVGRALEQISEDDQAAIRRSVPALRRLLSAIRDEDTTREEGAA